MHPILFEILRKDNDCKVAMVFAATPQLAVKGFVMTAQHCNKDTEVYAAPVEWNANDWEVIYNKLS